jgi:predicted nucleotidyltransferase
LTLVAIKASIVAINATLKDAFMSLPLASVLFKDYRRHVLGLLLLHPGESYHVREIARLTGTVAGTLHKELATLAKAGILTVQPRGNQKLYTANRDCPIFEELASILRKTSGMVDVLATALLPMAEQIDSACIFGSVAQGRETTHSDVDILLIGVAGFADIVKALYPCHEVLGREVNPKMYGKTAWANLVRKNDGFAREIIAKPKMFIIGGNEAFEKASRYQPSGDHS